MTRHELKEQLQHDQFREGVSSAVTYVSSHRRTAIRWSLVGVAVLAIAAGIFWFVSYQRTQRQQALQEAMTVFESQVGKPNEFAKFYPTQQAKDQATEKAFSDLKNKYPGSHEGLIAQYYLGTAKAERNDYAGAEADLKVVANSSSDFAPMAKMALAQLLAYNGRLPEAETLLHVLIDHPTSLVSKPQAQVMLAQIEAAKNPQEAKRILKNIQNPANDSVITRAKDEVTAQLPK